MKTKCAVLTGLNSDLEIMELEIPLLNTGQVLVRITSTGLCGSQINELSGIKGTDKYIPHLLGHEAYGIVLDIGDGVTKVKPYDCVIVTWIKGEGLEGGPKKYEQCNAGSVTTFQTYSVISENRLIKTNITPLNPSMYGCMIPTGFGSVLSFIGHSRSIRVYGSGNIGSAAILAAKNADLKVYVVDNIKEKLDYATYLGADFVSDSLKYLDKVDLAVDTTGNSACIESAFSSINDHGTVVVVGNSINRNNISIDPFELIKGKKLMGSWGGNCTHRDISNFILMNIDLSKLKTKTYNLEDINKAIKDFKSGYCGKIILEC
jgi:S-(hydroxymethyl)glutathione dehydrogenase / alcohol dehydrogenase